MTFVSDWYVGISHCSTELSASPTATTGCEKCEVSRWSGRTSWTQCPRRGRLATLRRWPCSFSVTQSAAMVTRLSPYTKSARVSGTSSAPCRESTLEWLQNASKSAAGTIPWILSALKMAQTNKSGSPSLLKGSYKCTLPPIPASKVSGSPETPVTWVLAPSPLLDGSFNTCGGSAQRAVTSPT